MLQGFQPRHPLRQGRDASRPHFLSPGHSRLSHPPLPSPLGGQNWSQSQGPLLHPDTTGQSWGETKRCFEPGCQGGQGQGLRAAEGAVKRGPRARKGSMRQGAVKGPPEEQEGMGMLLAWGSRREDGPLHPPPLPHSSFPSSTYKLCILDSGAGGSEWSPLSLESRSHEPSSSSLRQRRVKRGEKT